MGVAQYSTFVDIDPRVEKKKDSIEFGSANELNLLLFASPLKWGSQTCPEALQRAPCRQSSEKDAVSGRREVLSTPSN